MLSHIPGFPSRRRVDPPTARTIVLFQQHGAFASLCHNNYSHGHVQNLPFSPQLGGRSLQTILALSVCAALPASRGSQDLWANDIGTSRPGGVEKNATKSEHSTPDFPKLRSASSGPQKDGRTLDFLAGIWTDWADLGKWRARRTFGLGPCLAHVRWEGIGVLWRPLTVL